MYLLVFTTLMIGVMGIYAQILGLQTSRFAAHQNSVGVAMMQWHTAALSMAASIINTAGPLYTPLQTNGCRLTFAPIPGTTIVPCPSPVYMAGQTPLALVGTAINPGGGTITDNATTPNLINYKTAAGTYTTQCVHLPARCTRTDINGCGAITGAFTSNGCKQLYDTFDYQFYSVLYKDTLTGGNFVVTFVPAAQISGANPPPGFLQLASGNNIGITATDLLRQLAHAGAAAESFGSIDSAKHLATSGFQYTLPSDFSPTILQNANGAVGIIGTPDGL